MNSTTSTTSTTDAARAARNASRRRGRALSKSAGIAAAAAITQAAGGADLFGDLFDFSDAALIRMARTEVEFHLADRLTLALEEVTRLEQQLRSRMN